METDITPGPGSDEGKDLSTAVSLANSQTLESKISDSQDTYCEVMSELIEPMEYNQSKEGACSQSIFSQDTEYELPIASDILSSESLPKSSEVEEVSKPVTLVVLGTETDSGSDKNSAITITDSSDNCNPERSGRRKSLEHSPIPSKRSCLNTDHLNPGSSTSLDMSPVMNIVEENIPRQSTPAKYGKCNSPSVATCSNIAMRSSPRKVTKRSDSCNVCRELPPSQPARRLKRSMSADVDVRQKKIFSRLSPCDFKKMAKEIKNSNAVTVIAEEENTEIVPSVSGESQGFSIGDSQNVQLFLSPSTNEMETRNVDANDDIKVMSKNDSEHVGLADSHNNDVVSLSESNHHSGYFSSGDVQKLSSLGGNNTDQDSTISVEMDSPYHAELPDKLDVKPKPYLSNGYSSSTPENAPFTESLLLKKSFHISDSEGDNTPPFTDYNKQPDGHSKLSNTSKSDTSSNRNSSNSFLNNGHSNGSQYANTTNPTIPTFNIQMYTDDNNDFLSMFIVKTDNDLGSHTLKEYQKLSRRLTIDPYAGDASKSTSPSSVTSGGLLHLPPQPRSSFMSTTSSTSSSSRTSDGAFIIPQRPRKTLSFQTQPTTVKGFQALKQKLNEIITSLSEIYSAEDNTQSPMNSEEKNLTNASQENNMLPKSPDNKPDSNDCHRTTPKSSKKKIQTKTKRVLSGKIKKSDLSITNEEPQEVEGIHSPEMIPTDPDKCQQSHTPFRSEKQNFLEDNRNSPKTTPRGRKLKTASPAVQATCSTDNSAPATISEETPYPEGTLVLAKWVDKRYYSGKVKQALDVNKYLIQFDDGHTKSLLDDFIIFGNMTELPLVGQSIYAMVDDEQTYEPGLVLGVDKTECGTICYKCTTDRNSMVSVVASEIYLTEDQAKSFKESNPPKSPHSAPGTPRRRVNRELDLDNIIQGPRSARLRDKGSTPKGVISSPSSPKASTSSGGRGKGVRRMGGTPKRRQESESSEGGDSRASSGALEEVGGVQPEVQKTPRKIHGVRAHDLPIKGSSKSTIGKKCSKVTKFENDEDTVSRLGPIPPEGSTFFSGLHFLLTCTDLPRDNKRSSPKNWSDSEQYTESSPSTEKDEDNMLATNPFQKERLKEQLERAGGTVYSHFEDIPKSKYSVCKLIVPRPCLTAKYIQCLGANIRALSHFWVIRSCLSNKLMDQNEYSLSTGWSIERNRFIRWKISALERGSATPFKDKLILLCNDNDNFTKFWERVCSLAGANTRILTEENMELGGGIAVVTECDCPHEVQNKASLEGVPLVSTTWVVQCLIEGKILSFDGSHKYNFAYNDAE